MAKRKTPVKRRTPQRKRTATLRDAAVEQALSEASARTDDAIGGIPSPGLQRGPVNDVKARIAAVREKNGLIASGLPRMRTAGMMMSQSTGMDGLWGSSSLDAYHTSYASGNTLYGGGVRDVPTYFVMMNQQNGGVLYWPVSLREKYEWYRYFSRTDAYVGRALELLSDLPMSKITLNMPKIPKKGLKNEIYEFFQDMCENLNLFERLQEILWEWNMIGNSFLFHEWSAKEKRWNKIVMLPPEEVNCFTYPFSDNARIEYRPEKLMQIVKASADVTGYDVPQEDKAACSRVEMMKTLVKNIPPEVVKMIREQDCIVMDTDPMAGGRPGSFAYHFARRRSPYMDLGASVLERVLVPMLQKENYRYTQLALATRNMTPKNKISAPGLNESEIEQLRAQIDLSYMDPEYSVVTNYEWDWEQIGADARLLDLASEYEMIENQVFAGLGVTRELLTGEGTYSGNRITVEILNTIFLLTRQMLQRYVERSLFRPVAEAHKWYEDTRYGVRKYWYPRVAFNRLSIRDNQEVFENLFQLYQKGSMDIDVLYELFNLDSDYIHEKIKEQLFTVKDPNFNRTIENVDDEVGRALVERSDVVDKVGKYLGLKVSAPQGEGEGEFGESGFGGGFEGGFGAEEPAAEEESALDEMATSIAEELPEDADEGEVREVVEELAGAGVS